MAPRTYVDPTLPSSCARAATAAEARYRIQRPVAPARAPRIIALDDGAAEVVGHTAELPWANARFYVCEPADGTVTLRGIEGRPATLADELASADVVVMIATDDAGADCAYTIGKACWQRSIMTAGLVVSDDDGADRAVAALRPHARVLLPGADESDVVELLTALRA
ncbi:hypothetical protein K1T35_28415 [Pseudonocardia sp. DSM 110487]|uniref:hypothetical protein n=1 Tax=Pseudonocardia sp. DSM 110487 TaxID=2865833 RepID=UPI001C6A09C4|nr:hypothetical protein [Pseudonocardia sp. DSM 110487]QYN32501.1 hypothetical protein K1T35_28415 [Pseudonocardia sp. DSM 110487]